ncbi:MAG: DUF4838 domain-containing protein, partial [Victivallales bacterium]|nr:DUF4838 domain-containing protein [Victivallales bacterium]
MRKHSSNRNGISHGCSLVIRGIVKKQMTLFAAFATAIFALSISAESFIVKDGKPLAEIVIAENPPRSVPIAAEQLQYYIQRISGAKLQIVNKATSAFPVKIYVGKSSYTDKMGINDKGLKYGAYKIISGKDSLVLLGHDADFTPYKTYVGLEKGRRKNYDDWDVVTKGKFYNPMIKGRYCKSLKLWASDARGSFNAVCGFLRKLGVRWYFPGEIGEIVPEKQNISIPKVNKTVHPDFAFRNLYFYYVDFHRGSREEVLWQMRLGLNDGKETIGIGSGFGHGLQNVLVRDKSDPTRFAIFDGKRNVKPPKGVGMPCLSSGSLFKATLKYARVVFDTYPDQRMIDIGPPDGYGSLCQCPLCKEKGTFDRGWSGRMSDYVWDFVNRVAKELYKSHPDRVVNVIAYSGYKQPPLKIDEMSPNLTITICRWRSNFTDPEVKRKSHELTDAWLKKLPSKEIYIWDYYLCNRRTGPWVGVPAYFPHVASEDLKFLKGKSKGEFIEISRNHYTWNVPWHALAVNHLNSYVTARLYWNADLDIEKLLKEYYDKFYGPAAEQMKAFVDYSEANWPRAIKEVKVIDEMRRLITSARKAAGEGIYGKRVQMLVEYMKPLVAKRAKLAQGRKNVPELIVKDLGKAKLKLDGRLDEPFWKDLKTHVLKNPLTGGKASVNTTFKVAWAGDSLYFGIVCHDPNMKELNIGSKEDGNTNIFNGDEIELLLDPPAHSYYQIAFSPSGAMLDLDRAKGINTKWASQITVASQINSGDWTLEMVVPIAGESQEALDSLLGISAGKPTAKSPWYFNLCRQRWHGKTRELSTFSPTGRDGFHVILK